MSEFSGSVRRATVEDLDRVIAIDRDTSSSGDRVNILTCGVNAGDIIVFESNDRVLGFAALRRQSFFERDFLELLVVAKDVRRRGVATSLLKEVVSSSSTNRIFTSTNHSNTPMIQSLKKAGWKFSGQLDGLDEADPEMIYYRDAI